jgi:hypothetical protein
MGSPISRPPSIATNPPAIRPHIPSFQNLSSPAASSPRTWFSNDGHVVAHQSPIRIKAVAPCGAEPLAALAAPENPLFPTVSNRGSRSSWLHRSLASPTGDPTPSGSRRGRNERCNLGGIGAGVQSGLMVAPTHLRHCRRRPIDRPCPWPLQPKALRASNGVPSFMT